jgi:DNA polymerase-3 subunit epsilon/ATP-dependent DNA helicase DinG
LRFSNESFDTWDMAWILLPSASNYSLIDLAQELAIDHPTPHRALEDAKTAHLVFVSLLDKAASLDSKASSFIAEVSRQTRWQTGYLMTGNSATSLPNLQQGDIKLIDETLSGRLYGAPTEYKSKEGISLKERGLEELILPGGVLEKESESYEYRPQQVEMLRAVNSTLGESGRLIVEAGTGVGKSLAYLIPAVYMAAKDGKRVVISTNTINLQEQLLSKDIPLTLRLLESEGLVSPGDFKAACLKGRSNYLCLQRWKRMAQSLQMTTAQAKILSKTRIWLEKTGSGDRGEMNLSGREGGLWYQVSAQEGGQCSDFHKGACFLRSAREKSEDAHLVVINHALLLSDMVMGGSILSEYDHLIIDEAHHLEDEATRQLGIELSQRRFEEELSGLSRLLIELEVFVRGGGISKPQRTNLGDITAQIDSWIRSKANNWMELWGMLEKVLNTCQDDGFQSQLRLDEGVRSQAVWHSVELSSEQTDVAWEEGIKLVDKLGSVLEQYFKDSDVDCGALLNDLSSWTERQELVRNNLREILQFSRQGEYVDWISQDARSGEIDLKSAPLDVSDKLATQLFSLDGGVILTSASLTTHDNFEYMKQRMGFVGGDELLVDSPFDYNKATILLIPSDMPAPDSPQYIDELARAIVALARTLDGRTLVLFTSHSSLRAAQQIVKPQLQLDQIGVLAQGIDGPPAQLAKRFVRNNRSVLLGTSSFWEGVDLSEGVLKALVLAKLPFNVPNEPVFAARSNLYDDPFREYAIPQAVLRFRQGFGRLIRHKEDRGVIAILDNRVMKRNYGRIFLESLPACGVRNDSLSALGTLAHQWVNGDLKDA